MTRTVDVVVAGAGRELVAVAAAGLRRGERVLVLLTSSDTRVARRLRRRLRDVALGSGTASAVETNVEVVCVDGVNGVEAVVFRHRRTGRLEAVNASGFIAAPPRG